jgi:hypothetical protein
VEGGLDQEHAGAWVNPYTGPSMAYLEFGPENR